VRRKTILGSRIPIQKRMAQSSPAVRWCYTKFEDKDLFPTSLCKYRVEAEEICPTTGTKHWQCFVILNEKERFSVIRKRDVELGGTASHYEKAKADPYRAAMYCMKGMGKLLAARKKHVQRRI